MAEREKLEFTEQEGRDIIYGNHEDFEVVQDAIDGHSRWSIEHKVVVKRKSDGKFFRSYYSVGATEQQDQQAYEYCDKAEFFEVRLVTKTITVYE